MDIINYVKPTALIGLSAQKNHFTKEVLSSLLNFSKTPIIFSLSNPTSKAECTAEDAYVHTDGKCIFASGSPWAEVVYKEKTYHPSQWNNMYIFPGLGLGGVVSKSKIVTENMILMGSKALADYVTEKELGFF